MRPTGLMYLLNRKAPNDFIHGYTNAVCSGVSYRAKGWNDIEIAEGTFDWSAVDHALDVAKQHHKQFCLILPSLGSKPDWLNVTTYNVGTTASGVTHIIFLPWDSAAQPAMLNWIRAKCQHYDGRVDYMQIGELGVNEESYIAPHGVGDIGEDALTAVNNWLAAADLVIKTYADNLQHTAFCQYMARPFPGDSTCNNACIDNKMASFFRAKLAQYPGRFGVGNGGLNAHSMLTYWPNAIIHDTAATNPNIHQFLCSGAGFYRQSLGGTVEEVLNILLSFFSGNPGAVEIYGSDADDPTLADMLLAKQTLLAPH